MLSLCCERCYKLLLYCERYNDLGIIIFSFISQSVHKVLWYYQIKFLQRNCEERKEKHLSRERRKVWTESFSVRCSYLWANTIVVVWVFLIWLFVSVPPRVLFTLDFCLEKESKRGVYPCYVNSKMVFYSLPPPPMPS